MSNLKKLVSISVIVIAAYLNPLALLADDIDVIDIIKACEYKYPGEDQQSILTIELIDKDGNERRNTYKKLWKNYHGKNEVFDKMVLHTEFPPDAKGTGFMRWGYVADTNKMADQWLFLPQLRKVMRVSVRDPGDSFLGSDLSYGDMEDRSIDADNYELIRKTEADSGTEYLVRITPKAPDSQYSRKVSLYVKKESWDDCVRVRTFYYDRQGNLLKRQALSWQKKGGAWVWDKVLVENVQTLHKSRFTISDVKVDMGLKDRLFTERELKK